MTHALRPLPPTRRHPGRPPRMRTPVRRGRIPSAAATGARGPVRRAVAPALRLWRTLAPEDAGARTARSLARAVRRSDGADRGRHLRALADPAAAVALGIDVLHGRRTDCPETDMAMTVLLSHALRGDVTAPVVLAHGLAALAFGHADRDRLVRLSDEWARLGVRPRSKARRPTCGGGP